jgi:group I intron endonuclease
MAIYLVTNKVNGKVYIGKSTRPVSYRWQRHQKDALTGRNYFHAAIRKYGIDAFDIAVLGVANTRKQLIELEKRYIAQYESDNRTKGYNLTKGGDGGCASGNKHWAYGRSEVFTGSNNPFYGRHHSAETRGLISQKKKQYFASLTEAQIASLYASRRVFVGNSNPYFGKKHSEEVKARMGATKHLNALKRLGVAVEDLYKVCPVCSVEFPVPLKQRNKVCCSKSCATKLRWKSNFHSLKGGVK